MAVMVLVKLTGNPRDCLRDYDRVCEALIRRGNPPTAILSHNCAAVEDGALVVDVWPSEQAWNDFQQRSLIPAFQAAGLRSRPEVKIYQAYNVGWPGKFAEAEQPFAAH